MLNWLKWRRRQFLARTMFLNVGLVIWFALASFADAKQPSSLLLQAEQQRVATVERAARATVAIFPPGGNGGGSGVLISPDGFALSNHHVTSECGAFMKCGLNDGKLYDAVIVGIDPTGDVALIQLLGRNDFPTAPLGNSDDVQLGDPVFALGNPFILANDFQPTLSAGIISGNHRYQYPAGTFLEYADCLQTDAAINPGNSGGPLFNNQGEVIGINGRCSFDKRGRVSVGVGYAISINQIRKFLGQLRSGRVVDHATLGATVRTEAGQQKVVFDQIQDNSSLRRLGLREGDELREFAGRTIRSTNEFKNLLGTLPEGWPTSLTYSRTGSNYQVLFRLPPLHHTAELLEFSTGAEKKRSRGKLPEIPHPENSPSEIEGPAEYKHLFEERAGYANYAFNRLAQNRFLAFRDKVPMTNSTELPKWRSLGLDSKRTPVTLILDPRAVGLRWGDPYEQPLGGSDPLDEPKGTGGLLTGFHHWQRLMVLGSAGFEELYYFGTEPLDGIGPEVDTFVTRFQGVRCDWFINKETGAFAGWNTQIRPDIEPCEVRIEAESPSEGFPLPKKLRIRHKGREAGLFEFERWTLSEKGPNV